MKRSWAVLIIVGAFGAVALAQQAQPASPPPQGTQATRHQTTSIVKPMPKPVKVTPKVVRNAQTELQKRGYNPGAIDGVYGPQTRAAVLKFQADKALPQTGDLDLNTMEKLNVGGVEALKAAPSDVGRGGKAFGHNIREGHPAEAGKALGKGTVESGKKVAKGSESVAKKGAEKVGSGISKLGSKITGKAEGQPRQNPPQQQPAPPPSQQNPPPQPNTPPPTR